MQFCAGQPWVVLDGSVIFVFVARNNVVISANKIQGRNASFVPQSTASKNPWINMATSDPMLPIDKAAAIGGSAWRRR